MTDPTPKKKEYPNQSNMCGLTHKYLKWYETPEQDGKWLKFSTIRLSYTYVIKSWTYEGKTLSEKSLVPFGMVKTISLCSMKKCYHSYNALTTTVKDCSVKLTQQNFD